MSNFNDPDFDSRPIGALRPEHHIHDPSEPLPGAVGTGPAPDYETSETMHPSQTQGQIGEYGSGTPGVSTSYNKPVQYGYGDQGRRLDTTGRDTSTSASGIPREQMNRPLGVQPAREGGVAIGGRENEELPMGKASMSDKIIGKTEKVMGKLTHNPDMHEKGELREAGGKSAVTGSARAPHD